MASAEAAADREAVADGRRRVLVTGSAGKIGTLLMRELADAYDVRGIDRRRRPGPGSRRVDVRRLRAVRRAFADVDTVVDLAATTSEHATWRDIYRNNLRAAINLFEAARLAGVRRVVYASSNHAAGLYEHDEPYASVIAGARDGLSPADVPALRADAPVRPDGPYGVGKVFAEATGRYYAEVHGLSVICLRLGHVSRSGGPGSERHFATLLSHPDLVRLVRASIEAPADVRYGVYYGVSANTWRFWDLEAPRADLGFEPQDDAERWR